MRKLFLVLLCLFFCTASSFAQATNDTSKIDTNKKTLIVKQSASTTQVNSNSQAATAKAAAANTILECQIADWGIYKTTGWILIFLIVIVFLWVSKISNLLRVSIMDPDAFLAVAHATSRYRNVTDINKIKKPFSLYRSQLGIWTVVIGCSYIYLELCKYYPIPEIKLDTTLLALMGISAGTAAAGNVIDNNATPEQQGVTGPSEGFVKDIMSDQNGINIHRFQNVAWTLIAVTLYLFKLPDVPCGHLPTLDGTLVALTGISSATYLGLKVNENKPPSIPHTPVPGGGNTAGGPASPVGTDGV